MTTLELSAEQAKAIEQIQKLLNLAAKAGTPEEAAAASAKAQEMLAKHNLAVEVVERESAQGGAKRAQEAVDGGFYKWQQQLWRAVAELNFCFYWPQKYRATGRRQIRDRWTRKVIGQEMVDDRLKTRHALVGRLVNVRSTIAMAQYLQNAVERVLREKLHGRDDHRLSKWAVCFREGAVMSVVEKLEEQRATMLDAEEKVLRDRMRAASAGASDSTAVSLASFAKTEREANHDFVMGEGYSARKAAERAAQAKRRKEEEEAYTKWAAENPEEVAKQAREAEKREEKNASRRKGRSYFAGHDKTDWGAYRAGRSAGGSIGLAPQVDDGARSKIGG